MLKLDLQNKAGSEAVQSRWRQGLLPHFNGIVLGDGRLVMMNATTWMSEGRMQSSARPVCESAIESFIGFDGEFVELTHCTSAMPVEGDMSAVAGEGEMGNEGFVAVVSGEFLLWAAFFTTSNPFYKLALGDDKNLIATSTHELDWRFPVSAPWQVRVEPTAMA